MGSCINKYKAKNLWQCIRFKNMKIWDVNICTANICLKFLNDRYYNNFLKIMWYYELAPWTSLISVYPFGSIYQYMLKETSLTCRKGISLWKRRNFINQNKCLFSNAHDFVALYCSWIRFSLKRGQRMAVYLRSFHPNRTCSQILVKVCTLVI